MTRDAIDGKVENGSAPGPPSSSLAMSCCVLDHLMEVDCDEEPVPEPCPDDDVPEPFPDDDVLELLLDEDLALEAPNEGEDDDMIFAMFYLMEWSDEDD